MTEYVCYEMTAEGLAKFTPNAEYIKLGTGLGKAIKGMLANMDAHKRSWAEYESPIVGKMTMRRKRMGKAFTYTIESEMGFSYKEFRAWLAIALQYITGEYPVMMFNSDNSKVEFRRPKGGVIV